MNFDSEPLALDSNLDDFHFDLDGSDEFYSMLKSSKTSSGGADSRAEMERMLFEVDEYSSPPSFINSSFTSSIHEPALPTEEPKTNMLLLDAYNPCRTTHRRAIIKDEELVNDINFNTHGAVPPPPSRKKRKGRGGNKTREGYKQSRRVSCSDMDTLALGMTSSTPFTSHSSLNQISPPPRRATVGCDQAPSLAELFGNSSSSGSLANAMSSAGILQEPMPSDPLGEAEGEMNPTLEYHEALQKLAASMKRSELSRRQVMMQRNTHQHYQAHQVRNQVLTSIEQEQQRATTFGNTSPVSVADSSSVESNNRIISPTFPALPDKATIMKDFFSGSRGTLTNGLENSRMALRVYASEMYGKDPYNPYVMRRTSM